MSAVPVDHDLDDDGVDVEVKEAPPRQEEGAEEKRSERRTRSSKSSRDRAPDIEIEIEREITRRRLIESVTQIVVVILYMAFTLMRERDAGVVVLDEGGPEDDWQE